MPRETINDPSVIDEAMKQAERMAAVDSGKRQLEADQADLRQNGDDEIPPVEREIDDEPAQARAPADDDAGDDARPQQRQRREKPGDKRAQLVAEIAEKNKAARDAEPGETPPATTEAPAADAAQEPARTRKLRVDRQDLEVSEEEYDRYAHIGRASEQQFNEMKALTAHLRQELARIKNSGNDPGAPDSSASPQTTERTPENARAQPARSALSDEALDALGDRILYGEPEDRREALRELAEVMGSQRLDPREIIQAVRREEEAERSFSEAGRQFAQKHPEIAADADLAVLQIRGMHGLVLQELRDLNVDPSYLTPAMGDATYAFKLHKQLREEGYRLSQPDEISDRAATHIKSKFRLSPQTVVPSNEAARSPSRVPDTGARRQEREADKEALRQPRRAPTVARTPSAPQPRSRTQIVNDRRKFNGFRPVL